MRHIFAKKIFMDKTVLRLQTKGHINSEVLDKIPVMDDPDICFTVVRFTQCNLYYNELHFSVVLFMATERPLLIYGHLCISKYMAAN